LITWKNAKSIGRNKVGRWLYLQKAFLIIFKMSTTTKGCSSPVIARKYGINQKTAWLFMSKIRKAMASSGHHPLEVSCEVDEIMIGGHRTDYYITSI